MKYVKKNDKSKKNDEIMNIQNASQIEDTPEVLIDARSNIVKMQRNISILNNPESKVICRSCKRPIEQVKLVGLSLICPICDKPQEGEPNITL